MLSFHAMSYRNIAMSWIRFTTLFLCCVFQLTGCFTKIYALETPQSKAQWQLFQNELDGLRKEKNIPGLSVALVIGQKVSWSAGYGFADSNREVAVTPNTPFWIASLTKTFVGLSYLHLEAQGKLKLDELAADTPHFTGLCDWLASTTIPFATGLNCKAPITIRHILHHQVNERPGTQFMYNPIMYSRLSRHLENRFGQGTNRVEGRHNYLGHTIDINILEPAGMTRTMSSMWDRSKALVYFDLADGFNVDKQGKKAKLPRPDKHIAGGAGVASTALDLAKYDMAISSGLIAPGKIGKKLHQTGKFNDGSLAPYGFGWYFQCYLGEKLMWHSGWDPDAGYSALHLRLPERGLAFILLANSEGLWWGNPLTAAKVEDSAFAQLFFKHIGLTKELKITQSKCTL
jgi:CubicO group peptidase (beta-lactamase class C family)